LPETAERTHSRANRPRLSLSGGDHGGELGGAGVVTVQARPAVTILFKGRDESDATEWQPLVGKLLEKAPDPRLVLNEIVCRLHPSTWSGSLATVLEQRQRLLSSLPGSEDPVLVTTMAEAKARLHATINAERKREEEEASRRNTRFE